MTIRSAQSAIYAGSFLVKSARRTLGGYDTNPGRFVSPRGSAFYMIAPELLAASDWTRHSVVADLRGSFTGYGNTFPPPTDGRSPACPTNVDRPDFTGKIDGRLDVTRDTRINAEARLRSRHRQSRQPEHPGRLEQYPLYTTIGGTLGVEQDFNRLQLSAAGTVDRTTYQESRSSPTATSTTNDDRNFNQFGGIGRVSYDLMPGLKPFAELEGDSRVHDTQLDRNGFARDSTGGYVKAGTTFEFSRMLTGEASIGYAMRTYDDPRLNNLTGPADRRLADLDRDAADHREIHRQHLGRRNHAARRLRRADPHLHRRGRS